MRVGGANEAVEENHLRKEQQIEMGVLCRAKQSERITGGGTAVGRVLLIRHDAERLAEVLLMKSRNIPRRIEDAIVAGHDESGIILKEAIFNISRVYSQSRCRLHAYVLIKRLEFESHDPIFENVCCRGGANTFAP